MTDVTSDALPFSDRELYCLGETAGSHVIETVDEARGAALALAQQVRLRLRMFTRHLDAELYSTPEFREAVSELARRGPQTEVRILVQDPTPAIRRHHELIEVIQHLSSHVSARRVGNDWEDEICAFLLADESGLLWRPYGDRWEGSVDFAAGPRGREIRKWFDTVWESSEPEPEFRRLRI